MLKYFLSIFLSFNMLSFEILPKKNIDIDAWRFVKDQVMGGKSDGSMALKESTNENFDFISAQGNVSTDGGGFLMFRKEIDANNLGDFSRVKFKARGNNEKYFIHIKTKGSIFPWVDISVNLKLLMNGRILKLNSLNSFVTVIKVQKKGILTLVK